MSAELVPIRLAVTAGDLYTLWAPRWRDAGDEWEAFLGKDEDLYAFESVADLAAFVRTNTDNDISEHPAWEALGKANAHKLTPAEEQEVDLIAVAELLAEKPTEESVRQLAHALALVSSLGSVCELPTVTRFFNGNPTLGLVSGGMEHFNKRSGRKRWDLIGDIINRSWDSVLAAIDEIITIPPVDEAASKLAAEELDEPYEEPEVEIVEDDAEVKTEDESDGTDAEDEADPDVVAAALKKTLLGDDKEFWGHVGIDPIRVMTAGGTLYTLRCYFDDRPIFLGRNGRISVFPSERTLARYLADEHDHDLADLSTYEDIRTAATDGSLRVEVSDENIYVLTGLADDVAEGAYAIDRDQLELAIELIRDVGDYSGDDTVDKLLSLDHSLGRLVHDVIDPEDATQSQAPSAAAVKGWEELEQFVESRFRRE